MTTNASPNKNLRPLVFLAFTLIGIVTVAWGLAESISPDTRPIDKGPPSKVTTTFDDAHISTKQAISIFERLKTEQEFAVYYRKLLNGCSELDLEELIESKEPSIAIQAAWELAAVTVPENTGTKIYRPDAVALKRFLEVVNKRIRMDPPEWWRTIIIDAQAHHRGNIFPGPLDPWPSPAGVFSEDGIGNVIYTNGDRSIPIPEELLSRNNSDQIAGIFTDQNCFVATCSSTGSPHDIACLDLKTADIVWTSQACGCSRYGISHTGFSFSYSSMISTEDHVFVFGFASGGFYVHGFDSKSGETCVQFNSKY